jgi:hypothetical protein
MRRAPASFLRALHGPPARRDSQEKRRGNGAALGPGALRDWRPPARPFAPRAVPFRASIRAVRRCPLARRSAWRFSRPPGLAPAPAASAPRAQLHPSDARATGAAGEPRRGRRAPSRAPFAFAPARHSRSHSARHGASHFARCFLPPHRGARDAAHAREDRAANDSMGPRCLRPRASLRAPSRAPFATGEPGGASAARGPAAPVRRARALHEPSRPAWTCPPSPAAPVRRYLFAVPRRRAAIGG